MRLIPSWIAVWSLQTGNHVINHKSVATSYNSRQIQDVAMVTLKPDLSFGLYFFVEKNTRFINPDSA